MVLDVKQELFLAVRSIIKYKTIARIFILIPVSNSLVLYLQELKPDFFLAGNKPKFRMLFALLWHGMGGQCCVCSDLLAQCSLVSCARFGSIVHSIPV